MTPARGIGMKSARSEARELYSKLGWRPERIAETLGEDVTTIQEWIFGKPRKATKQAGPISPASLPQRRKVKGSRSVMSGQTPCDPCHLVSRALGGCDEPECVFPLTRAEHRLFDEGKLDVLAALIAGGYVAELQHALGHLGGSPLRLLHVTTGQRWIPEGGGDEGMAA